MVDDNMKIKRLTLGVLHTNCYILYKNEDALIIDPADDFMQIKNSVKGYNVKGILVTHHHFDHIGALDELEKHFNLKHNSFDDGFDYEIIKTPGHASDLMSFYFPSEKVMFTGDFLFYHTIGRCDLPESNIDDMKKKFKYYYRLS